MPDAELKPYPKAVRVAVVGGALLLFIVVIFWAETAPRTSLLAWFIRTTISAADLMRRLE
jgi:hypothetical protein